MGSVSSKPTENQNLLDRARFWAPTDKAVRSLETLVFSAPDLTPPEEGASVFDQTRHMWKQLKSLRPDRKNVMFRSMAAAAPQNLRFRKAANPDSDDARVAEYNVLRLNELNWISDEEIQKLRKEGLITAQKSTDLVTDDETSDQFSMSESTNSEKVTGQRTTARPSDPVKVPEPDPDKKEGLLLQMHQGRYGNTAA